MNASTEHELSPYTVRIRIAHSFTQEAGLCQCGCGNPAPIATRTRRYLGHVKGEPIRFISGHNARFYADETEGFWARVDQSGGPGACWPWIGGKATGGYGTVVYQGHQERTHRLAYRLTYGEIDRGLLVRHDCDNPCCCNPSHLRTGTNADNTRDRHIRGRDCRGERHHKAKLRADVIPVIRARWASGESFTDIARDFGVTYQSIERVARRKSWRHVQ